jgi:spermidine/putrescine transport system permease protein
VAAAGVTARRGTRGRLTPYALLLPGLAWLAIFYVWPTIQMFFISLQEGNLASGYRLT